MIVDSSAVIAIIKGEPESEQLSSLLTSSDCRMSVANWLECGVVSDRDEAADPFAVEALVATAEIELVPVSVEQARIAREAHRRFGKGSGSRARLNFGDCFAYALAKSTDEPLLFKGDDFTHTDIRSAGADRG